MKFTLFTPLHLFYVFGLESCSFCNIYGRHSHTSQIAGNLQNTLGTTLGTTFFKSYSLTLLILPFHYDDSIAIMAETFIILTTLLLAQRSNLGYLRQLLENGILGQPGHALQYIHVLQYINKTFKYILTFFGLLCKVRQLKIDQTHLVGKDRAMLHVHQGNICSKIIRNVT